MALLHTEDILQTLSEVIFLLLHVSVFACICRQIRSGVTIFSSAFFKLYLLRSMADYASYITGSLACRLIQAGVFGRPPVAVLSATTFVLMFGVYFQLFMYVAVVTNRYTAIAHPARHSLIWKGRMLIVVVAVSAVLSVGCSLLFELGNRLYNGSTEAMLTMILVPVFGVSTTICLTSSALQARTIWVYHRLEHARRKQLKEEFLLLGYAVLGMLVPVGISCIFGLILFQHSEQAGMAWPYLVDYMCMCEPVWLLLTSSRLRSAYWGMLTRRGRQNKQRDVILFSTNSQK